MGLCKLSSFSLTVALGGRRPAILHQSYQDRDGEELTGVLAARIGALEKHKSCGFEILESS